MTTTHDDALPVLLRYRLATFGTGPAMVVCSQGAYVKHADADAALESMRQRLEEAERDAARYRALREAGSALKLYVYDDPDDPCSGDWLYKPSPEAVDTFCAHLAASKGA